VTVSEIKKLYFDSLDGIYPENELKAIFQLVVEDLWNLSRTDVLLNVKVDFEAKKQDFQDVLTRLKKYEPIQYILGKASFYGRSFFVNKHTLIPRQETEELIQLIGKLNLPEQTRMLDIGTGSGIIPIICALEFRFSHIEAIDISSDALIVAIKNAKKQVVDIRFSQLNVLSDMFVDKLQGPYNLIISNPPYVTESEQKLMKKNVLDYEPHLALFVSDDQPLIFYEKIVQISKQQLASRGVLVVEINENYGEETKSLFEDNDLQEVTIVKDIHGKDRFVYGIKH